MSKSPSKKTTKSQKNTQKKVTNNQLNQYTSIIAIVVSIVGLLVAIFLSTQSADLRNKALTVDYSTGSKSGQEYITNCTPGASRCEGSYLFTCLSGKSEASQLCQFGCKDNSCLSESDVENDESTMKDQTQVDKDLQTEREELLEEAKNVDIKNESVYRSSKTQDGSDEKDKSQDFSSQEPDFYQSNQEKEGQKNQDRNGSEIMMQNKGGNSAKDTQDLFIEADQSKKTVQEKPKSVVTKVVEQIFSPIKVISKNLNKFFDSFKNKSEK